MPRTGRPHSQNPKNSRVTVRLTEPLFQKLEDYCREHKLERAEAVRIAVERMLEKDK